MTDVEVLMATMHASDPGELLGRAKVTTAAVLVNQNSVRSGLETVREDPRQVVSHSLDRGLSRSRNEALSLARAEICLLADDDEVFLDCYPERVATAFDEHRDADIIAFSVQFRDAVRSPPRSGSQVGRLSLMRLSSVQLAFRRRPVTQAGLRFHTRFGAGAPSNHGEELIFLNDARRLGLHVAAVPLEIAYLTPRDSTWFSGYDEEYFRSRGASFYEADPPGALAYIIQWAIRKRRLFAPATSIPQAVQWMVAGAAEARSLRGKER